MKSKTSSCKTALRKDLSRFWPVWAGYLLFQVFIQMILNQEAREYWYLSDVMNSTAVMGMVNCLYGMAVAQMLFGDLFNPRMCSGLHSLPLKREHWFGAHLKSGFLFSLVPTALSAVLMAVVAKTAMLPGTVMINGWQIPVYWWAVCNLQYLFFYGLSVFCMICTGNRFAAGVVYGMLNTFSLLGWGLVEQFYTPLLHGVLTQSRIFKLLSPVYWLSCTQVIDTRRTETGRTYIDEFGAELPEYIGSFVHVPENWLYLGILAALGVVLLLLARRMYQKRKLECAGDFMAVKWLEPVFQVVFTVLCAAGVQGGVNLFFGYLFDNAQKYVVAVLGLVAGWFVARMCLERSTRVFRLKSVAGVLLLTAVLGGSLYVTELDPLGIEDWVPQAGEVKKVQMVLSHRTDVITEDPEEIADFLRLHELALEEKITVHADYDDYFYNENQEQNVAYVRLTYTLENGWTAEREYYIQPQSEAGRIARTYASRLAEVIGDKDQVKDLDDLKHVMKKITFVGVAGKALQESDLQEEFLMELAEAIYADCENGSMVQSAVYHPEYVFESDMEEARMQSLHLDLSGKEFSCYMNVYADCENTMALLESTGIVEVVRQSTIEGIRG